MAIQRMHHTLTSVPQTHTCSSHPTHHSLSPAPWMVLSCSSIWVSYLGQWTSRQLLEPRSHRGAHPPPLTTRKMRESSIVCKSCWLSVSCSDSSGVSNKVGSWARSVSSRKRKCTCASRTSRWPDCEQLTSDTTSEISSSRAILCLSCWLLQPMLARTDN
jgi:hypothetical protein